MRVMKKALAAAALVLAAALAAAAAEPDAKVLMQADRDFNAQSQKEGGKAWEHWFAESAVKPGRVGKWITGNKAIGEQMTPVLADPNFSLTWEPVKAEISKGGNLGSTWGRWTRRRKEKDGSVKESHGDYLTVWEKQQDGSWRIVFDTGDVD